MAVARPGQDRRHTASVVKCPALHSNTKLSTPVSCPIRPLHLSLRHLPLPTLALGGKMAATGRVADRDGTAADDVEGELAAEEVVSICNRVLVSGAALLLTAKVPAAQ